MHVRRPAPRTPVEEPATAPFDSITACYAVCAQADPDVVGRLLGVFAQVDLRPDRMHTRRVGDRLSIAVEQAAISELQANRLAECLRAVAHVEQVSLECRLGRAADTSSVPPGRRRGGRPRGPLLDAPGTCARWLPMVERLRPGTPWRDVASALQLVDPAGRWTARKIAIAVRRLVTKGAADPQLLRWSHGRAAQRLGAA